MAAAVPAKATRTAQIRPALRAALVSMVHDGSTITEAAEKAGLARESLSKALRKPHVQAELANVRRAWTTNETAKAWLVVARLAESAASEDVQLKAARTILDAAGQLSGDKNRDAPRAAQLVNIILQGGTQPVLTVGGSGVIEAASFEAIGDDD